MPSIAALIFPLHWLPGRRQWLALIPALALCPLVSGQEDASAPPLALNYAKVMEGQAVAADQPIFDADKFPLIDFHDKDLIVAALGAYTLKIRYFDADFNEVQTPAKPGRYGAQVEITFPSHFSEVQNVTLYRTPKPYPLSESRLDVTVPLPEALGLSGDAKLEEWNKKSFFADLIRGASRVNDASAMLVASLHDIEADPARWQGFTYWGVNHAWWNGLEKKLGAPQDYPRIVTVPPDYDKNPGQRWPLILFLHGSGERGGDLNKLKNQGPLGYINTGHPLPFIVVEPQCPGRDAWDSEKLALLLDNVEKDYRVDPKRVYVTGLSIGGFATLELAATYPQRFAAIAPLSSGGDPGIATRLKTVPTWIFHGAEDNHFPASYSSGIADEMKAEGAVEVKLTVYPGVGHGGWDLTSNAPALYDWFSQHSLP